LSLQLGWPIWSQFNPKTVVFLFPFPQPRHVKRYHYRSHDELKTHMQTMLMAYNFATHLKTLKRLTPYEYICKICSEDRAKFIINPHHDTVGLNT
jgi:hypothetical protein